MSTSRLALVVGVVSILGLALLCGRDARADGQQPPAEKEKATAKPETAKESEKAGAAKAPDFTLEDHNGKKVSLADFKDKIVVLEWLNPQCPFVVRHYENKTMTTLAEQYKDKGVVWLAIDSTKTATTDAHKDWAAKYGVPYAILNDSAGKVAKLYGAKTTPHIFIIDKKGMIVYKGAIDADATAKGPVKPETVNYVRKALDEILADKPVSTPETKPYGCSVKYK